MERKRLQILIVDDDGDLLKVLARRFNARGYEVFTAADGDQALEAARARRMDVVLLDLEMPRLDGIFVLRELLEKDPSLPVIIMSGVATPEQAKLVLDEGARDFIAKPPDFGRLEAVVEAAAGRSGH